MDEDTKFTARQYQAVLDEIVALAKEAKKAKVKDVCTASYRDAIMARNFLKTDPAPAAPQEHAG